jgi:hypothetical protein
MKNVYEFKFGHNGQKVIFAESTSLIGVQLRAEASIEELKSMLKGNATEVGTCGSYRVFQILNENTDEIINKIHETYPSIKTGHIYHTPDGKGAVVPTGDIYVVFKQTTSTPRCLELLEKYHLTEKKRKSEHAFVAQAVDNPLALTVTLQNDSDVEIAEPDFSSTPEKRLALR